MTNIKSGHWVIPGFDHGLVIGVGHESWCQSLLVIPFPNVLRVKIVTTALYTRVSYRAASAAKMCHFKDMSQIHPVYVRRRESVGSQTGLKLLEEAAEISFECNFEKDYCWENIHMSCH